MTSKKISVSEDVYRALQNARGEDESISDVIERLLEADEDSHSLYGLVGILDDSEVRRVREQSERFRESADDRLGNGS